MRRSSLPPVLIKACLTHREVLRLKTISWTNHLEVGVKCHYVFSVYNVTFSVAAILEFLIAKDYLNILYNTIIFYFKIEIASLIDY